MLDYIRCATCPMMKITGRAKQTANSWHLKEPRGYCGCTHPEAKAAFKIISPKSPQMAGFIAFTKGSSDEPNIQTTPKWCPRKLMERPQEIRKKEAYQLISNRHPLGLFYLKEGEGYTAIDNRTGEAWTEEFNTKGKCLRWLKEQGGIK